MNKLNVNKSNRQTPRTVFESMDKRDYLFPWEEDAEDAGTPSGSQTIYVAPDPFPTTEVHREGYGLVTEGRADINPAVYPDMEFDGDGDLLPPREWGA